ncbi:hypothetical protein GCM10011575_21130 [Microlunatus endophyticus]|uniref:Uncharacterized protein n=1 Tax=Microlunatus endophyticus TaxID=1716077 RepID=A0A917S7M1_9ACTN|nr:hypothetical protein [Microlunatus endophyticus]GGL62365.1 hypothetical protein GCM10011575_21130 [Microlunatus endophyticus]
MAISRFYRRRFLNRRGFHAGAYVLADCRVLTERVRDGNRRYVDAELTIADCSRVVSLDLSAYSEADARNSLYKARLLRAIIDDFTDTFEDALHEAYPDLK